MKIGLALSGGGFRASVFHLGILARISEESWLEKVNFISTVSGGSLVTGLIFHLNGNHWPTSGEFVTRVLPETHRLLTTLDLQASVVLETLLTPLGLLFSRAKTVSRKIRSKWGIEVNLSDLPSEPRWVINSTCYETGRNWRFESFRMGDYIFGYAFDQDYPLCDAMAASSGVPIVIGPISLKTNKFQWRKYKKNSTTETEPIEAVPFEKVHLWDGGVYDNLGMEPLVNYSSKDGAYTYRSGVDYVIASNASGTFFNRKYAPGIKAMLRLINIPKYQIEALRSRDMIHRLIHHGDKGSYFKMGNSCRNLLQDLERAGFDLDKTITKYLPENDVEKIKQFPTVIRKLSKQEFMLLFRHGYEVADCTLYKYEEKISLRPYQAEKWESILAG